MLHDLPHVFPTRRSSDLVRDRAWRQEYFVERDVLETRSGRDGRYATFAGAAFDIPLDARGQQITLLAGVQEFSGDNVRTHLRRSEEHTSELQSLMRISYAVFCLKNKKN